MFIVEKSNVCPFEKQLKRNLFIVAKIFLFSMGKTNIQNSSTAVWEIWEIKRKFCNATTQNVHNTLVRKF